MTDRQVGRQGTPVVEAPEPDVADDAEGSPPLARQILGLSAIAVAVGLLAGAGASAFLAVEHRLQGQLWHEIPRALGQQQAAPWLVLLLLVTGAVIVYLAEKLPGGGGKGPLQGLGLNVGPGQIISVVIAALGGLSCGAVLGPEAPLMAVGTALAGLAFRKPANPARQVMLFVGAMAAIGAIFGNPLITTVFMLDFVLLTGPRFASPVVLMPALAGLASSYTLQVGVAPWSGLGEIELSAPGLAPYRELHVIDATLAVPVAIVVSVVAMATRLGGERFALLAARTRLGGLVGAGVVIALCALLVDAITGGGLDLVLFSGQSAMAEYLAVGSVDTAVVILVGKFLAYAVSLGGGFRGGPIFPAVSLGALISATAALIAPGASTTALAATGISAAVAASMRMPFTALLVGVVLTYTAGGATTILAILGTIVGLSTRFAGERFAPKLTPATGRS
jgi:H+/Cl- antiporter ClcA